MSDFLQLTGSLNWLGHGALLQPYFVTSSLQQSVGLLTVAHMATANKLLQEIKSLHPEATMLPPEYLKNPSYLLSFESSQRNSSYGQTGYISGLYLLDGSNIYHALYWHSSKQSCASFSSIGADILAAATWTDLSSLMAKYNQIFYGSSDNLPFTLTVKSKCLYTTTKTFHESHDIRLRPTVSRVRVYFENSKIAIMQCIFGYLNNSNALTKRNLSTYLMLNEVLKMSFCWKILCLTSISSAFSHSFSIFERYSPSFIPTSVGLFKPLPFFALMEDFYVNHISPS